MIFLAAENLRPGCPVMFEDEQTAFEVWESREEITIPFLTFAEKTDMITKEDFAIPAKPARDKTTRGVFYGSTDPTAVSGLSPSDLSSFFSCREGGHLTTATLSTAPTSPVRTLSSAIHRACLCARTAEDNKAREIVVLDMRKVTPLYDFFVIVTGASRRQIHTLAEEVDAAMHHEGDSRMGIEGYEASKWVVQDYGDVLVHVFDPDTRSYYNLEELWADAPRIDWQRE